MTKIETGWQKIRMIDGPQRPNLVIVRTGKNSIHTQWDKSGIPQGRNWDLLLSHYAESDPDCPDAEIIVLQNAYKFSACYRLFQDIDWLKHYKAVAFIDDDIMTSWADINRMFDILHEYDLLLAQPSLTSDSFFAHRICLQQPHYFMHFTNYVEVMAPFFSAAALQSCLGTFKDTITAWGIDWVWPHLLGNPRSKVAVVDAVAIHHTRPILHGDLYKTAKQEHGINPFKEHDDTMLKYNITSATPLVYGWITIEPCEFGVKVLPPISQELATRMDQFADYLDTDISIKNYDMQPVLIENWQSTGEKASRAQVIPALSAKDLIMSFGIDMKLDPVLGNNIEVFQIGDDRHQARATITINSANQTKYHVNIRIIGSDNTLNQLTLFGMPFGENISIMAQLIPCAGYVKMWLNGHIAERGVLTPWLWHSTRTAWLGSRRLKGKIQNCWVSQSTVKQDKFEEAVA